MKSRSLLISGLTIRRMILLVGILLCIELAASALVADDFPPDQIAFFESKIRPLLVSRCNECHSLASKKVNGGLAVDSRETLLKGGDSGPAVVSGDPEKSLLILAVRRADKDLQMPPKQKLSDIEIADLETWVKQGLPDPRTTPSADAAASANRPKYGVSLEEGREFWSMRPVKDSPLPAIKNSSWPRNRIDHFILAKLEAAGINPAPPADKRTLLRRVTFDLTGLPPTPRELDAFLADDSPQAFEHVIDRLLASPRYGERWGRYWLDVVRYSDTCGNASDYPVPQAAKYRDWVVRAVNRDLPYDQFLREQLAGDLLPSTSDAERHERILATGYLAIARRFGGSRTGEHYLTIEDTIDNLGKAVLGSSISCARCHDHKFDPFTMHDYYGLVGIFESTRYPFPGAEVGKRQEDFVPLISPAEIEAIREPYRQQVSDVGVEAELLDRAVTEVKKLPESPEKATALKAAMAVQADAKKRQAELNAAPPSINDAYAVADAQGVNSKVHLRGDPKRLGDEVPRHFPAVLGGQQLPPNSAASGRLQLAQWVTDPSNPLTARVMVNRIWQHHFGKGLVATPNDFGRRGTAPTHPELLDFLAARFIESGWSLKAMHRLMLLSQTWQLSNGESAGGTQQDPANDLLARYPRRRLDAESIRDTILFVSGELDESAPGVHPFPPTKNWNWTQHNPFFAVYESRHRSIYLMQQRLRKNAYLALFDGADPSSSTGARLPSTTPLQALFVMNDAVVHNAAAKFAAQLIAAGSDDATRIDLAYRTAFSRSASADELGTCTEFLQTYRQRLTELSTPKDQLDARVWSALARSLMSTNEFIFVD